MIREHDPEDLAKGWLRLGREFKSEPVDITDRLDDIELVSCWKQTGERPDTGHEATLWLWDRGYLTKYNLDVWKQGKGHWYVCLDDRQLGILYRNKDDLWIVDCKHFAAFHFHYESRSSEAVLRACLRVHSQGHEYR